MSIQEFKLPDIGEGIAEGEIVSWKVEVGQPVKEEDDFVEVMTDKATVTITVPYDGVVKELRAAEGEVVPVESVIAVFDTSGGGASSAPAKQSAAAPAGASAATPAPVAATPQPVAVGVATPAFEQASPGKVLAAPATRKRARELGIDLRGVAGTGPSGRVTNEDLASHGGTAPAGAPAAIPAARPVAIPTAPPMANPSASSTQLEERIPFRGLRRKIADAMSRSMHTAVHFTYVDDINVTKLVALRKKAKEMYAETGVNVTYLPFIMKAIVAAMRQFPQMNSALDETTQELVVRNYYNFGIATDTDQGLIVPVVKDVASKSIVQLARDIQDLAERTRTGKVSVDELQGGTFTITNAGNIGGLFASPVINFPEVAILGVHAIKPTPVIDDDGGIVAGHVMYLSVSIDHRIVDGATGARWMNVIKTCLEEPSRLLFEGV